MLNNWSAALYLQIFFKLNVSQSRILDFNLHVSSDIADTQNLSGDSPGKSPCRISCCTKLFISRTSRVEPWARTLSICRRNNCRPGSPWATNCAKARPVSGRPRSVRLTNACTSKPISICCWLASLALFFPSTSLSAPTNFCFSSRCAVSISMSVISAEKVSSSRTEISRSSWSLADSMNLKLIKIE